jgi:hypothetical protein
MYCLYSLNEYKLLALTSSVATTPTAPAFVARLPIKPPSVNCEPPGRNSATRPWQHLFDPFSGYLRFAEELTNSPTHYRLGWSPCWDYATTIESTVSWYRAVHEGASALECCLADLSLYHRAIPYEESQTMSLTINALVMLCMY